MIKKFTEVIITDEEIKSPEPIQTILRIRRKDSDEYCDYTINYPKEKENGKK